MKTFQLLAGMTAISLLTACGGSNVNTVKKYSFEFNKSMNIGTAIDGSPMCQKVQWKDESTKEQKLVAMTCYLPEKDIKEWFDNETNNYQEIKNKVNKTREDAFKSLEKEYKKMMTDNSPEFNQEKISTIIPKVCQKDENADSGIKCDINEFGKAFQLKEKGWSPGFFTGAFAIHDLRKLYQNTDDGKKVCADWLKECREEPQMPQSMSVQVVFAVNTDKTVNVAKVAELMNDQVTDEHSIPNQNEQINRQVLSDFYQR